MLNHLQPQPGQFSERFQSKSNHQLTHKKAFTTITTPTTTHKSLGKFTLTHVPKSATSFQIKKTNTNFKMPLAAPIPALHSPLTTAKMSFAAQPPRSGNTPKKKPNTPSPDMPVKDQEQEVKDQKRDLFDLVKEHKVYKMYKKYGKLAIISVAGVYALGFLTFTTVPLLIPGYEPLEAIHWADAKGFIPDIAKTTYHQVAEAFPALSKPIQQHPDIAAKVLAGYLLNEMAFIPRLALAFAVTKKIGDKREAKKAETGVEVVKEQQPDL